MDTIKCLIVDDESLARKLLTDYVSKFPELELIGTCKSALDAMALLNREKVDLLFLDIQMPELTGIEFLRAVPNRPIVIMTTAYSDHALEGFELGVFDYLLKPIPLPRFMQSVSKAIERIQNDRKVLEETAIVQTPPQTIASLRPKYLTVKADHKLFKINYSDLIYIEGQREYVTFHTVSRKITAFYSLKSLEEKLPSDEFIRIHKSYIVSIDHIQTLEGNILEVAGEKLPIGKSFKSNVNDVFSL